MQVIELVVQVKQGEVHIMQVGGDTIEGFNCEYWQLGDTQLPDGDRVKLVLHYRHLPSCWHFWQFLSQGMHCRESEK